MKKSDKLKNGEKTKTRDLWIYNSWFQSGTGFHKNKKKILERKQKHKNKYMEEYK